MEKEFICTKSTPIVETAKGKIRGFRYDGVDHFYGIRYATAKRFQMPEPVEPWEGVKDATGYGPVCPVLNQSMSVNEMRLRHRFWLSSEHCQYLNVWSTKCDPSAKKPVMFWIHGGAYTAGSSIELEYYDGFNLAKLDDVVVVSVNHRLNAFGYLDLSDFGEKYANSVNAGMADLVEALRWVRDNIAAFGGDPDNVTIFGQSGGGGKVTVLCQIPEANGLFHKAIIMSGVLPTSQFFTNCTAKEVALAILEKLNISENDVEKLERVPVPQFIWAVNKATFELQKKGIRISWGPKPNDYFVADALDGGFTPHSLTVPTMLGTVIAEFGYHRDLGEREGLTDAQREAEVKAYYGEEGGQKILDTFKKVYPGKNVVYAIDLEAIFLPDTVKYVKKKAAEASAPVYSYMFAKVFDYDGGHAAWHCSEIPFFFHNAEMTPICHQPNYKMLDSVMSSAFVNFARTGNPNVDGLPQWERCTEDKTVTMVFDDECHIVENMYDELLPLVLEYKPMADRNFDMRVKDDDDVDDTSKTWLQ